MRSSTLVTFSLTLSVLTIALILPYGLLTHTSTKAEFVAQKRAQLKSIATHQSSLLDQLMKLRERLDVCRSSVMAVTKLDEKGLDADEEIASRIAVVKEQLAQYQSSLSGQLAELEKETKKQFADLKDLLESNANRFVVKWHSDDGVKTSPRMATEQEAVEKFTEIGEFAKKLLMFDGQRWIPLKVYGGEKWLALMHDNGDVQDGDGKVEKLPKGKAAGAGGPKAEDNNEEAGRPPKEEPANGDAAPVDEGGKQVNGGEPVVESAD
jgi:hypothetical protein